MITRILQTKVWKDEFFSELTPTEKLLFVYYLTNERVNIIHCYEVTDREISFDTGIDRASIGVFKEKVSKSQKMVFFKNWVYLRNASKYENYTGDKNENKKDKLIKEMSDEIKGWYTKIVDTPIDTPIYTGPIGTINHKSKIINHKSIYATLQSIENDELVKELSKHFNVPEKIVISQREALKLYCLSKGKTYKDYKAAWMNFIRGYIEKNPSVVIKKPVETYHHEDENFVPVSPARLSELVNNKKKLLGSKTL